MNSPERTHREAVAVERPPPVARSPGRYVTRSRRGLVVAPRPLAQRLRDGRHDGLPVLPLTLPLAAVGQPLLVEPQHGLLGAGAADRDLDGAVVVPVRGPVGHAHPVQLAPTADLALGAVFGAVGAALR